MATQSTFGWELPDLSDIADGPNAFLEFADDVAGTIADGTWISYTPTWTSVPGQVYPGNPTNTQPSGTTSRTGYYRLQNKTCDFIAELQFGPSTYGSWGGLAVGIPVPASTLHYYQPGAQCALFTPRSGTSWQGIAYIDAGATVCRPHFAISGARCDMLPWTSAGGLYVNRGIPDSNGDGLSSVQAGGGIYIQGRYRTA